MNWLVSCDGPDTATRTFAKITELNTTNAPHDRSIPAAFMRYVSPAASSRISAVLAPMAAKLVTLKNTKLGDVKVKMRISATRMPRIRLLVDRVSSPATLLTRRRSAEARGIMAGTVTRRRYSLGPGIQNPSRIRSSRASATPAWRCHDHSPVLRGQAAGL